jgi:hypothetical protein
MITQRHGDTEKPKNTVAEGVGGYAVWTQAAGFFSVPLCLCVIQKIGTI